MYKIWVRIKGSLTGTQGYYYSTESGVYRTTCRQEAKTKCFALYGEARKYSSALNAKYDFKVIEV